MKLLKKVSDKKRRGHLAILVILLVFGFVSCATAPAADDYVDKDKWNLVWADEFSGWSIDSEKWAFDLGGHGFGNHELQYYTNGDNAFVRWGKLVIEARKEKHKGNPYTSAKLWTKGKASWRYGKIAVRAKLPKGQGIWPAVWMLPKDPYAMKWPAGGEIDIVELVGQAPHVVHGTLHYGEPHEFHGGKYTLEEGDFSDDFHVFTIEWEPGRITWFVDGEQYYTRTEWFSNDMYNRKEYEFPAPFNKEFMLILNVAVGGEWPGPPDNTTEFPQRMVVDYVRVYKQAN
mgnify:CR=1 FL=1